MTGWSPDWDVLRRAIGGDVLVPGANGYDVARRPALARFHDNRRAERAAAHTWADAYYGTNDDRLLRAKRKYDPGNWFRLPRSLSSPNRDRGFANTTNRRPNTR